MEKEKLAEKTEAGDQDMDHIKQQMLILDALGRDYLNITLIDTKRKMASVLRTNFSMENSNMGKTQEFSYERMCRESIERFVAKEQRPEIAEKVNLEHVVSELEHAPEYGFLYETTEGGENHVCQFKYTKFGDGKHILMAFRFVDEVVSKEKERDRRKSAEELRKERIFLEVLCRDYTSVYYFDLNKDMLEILKIDAAANSANMVGQQLRRQLDYSTEMKKYCNAYVVEEEREEFLKKMSRDFIREQLSCKDQFSFRYQSDPNKAGHRYFEAQAFRITDAEFDNTAILAFRHIDETVAAEQQREQELKEAMEREERTKQLERERQDAVNANEMKSRFLSSLSHDIRTPVNGILGMLRIADANKDNPKKQNECREKIWIACDYLVTLVNNVLDMNRLENKAIDLSEQPFNLIDLLMGITSMTDMQSEAQGLHSIVDWKPGYIKHRYLIGSAEGLSRILMNLNSNAIKYNKKGGTIYCRCLETECDGETAWFELVTADTGVGMDEAFLKHAFEPYTQKNNRSLNSMNGVGLGLSIVKQTVELMGGTMKVESKPGEGTKYTIMMPFKINHNPQKKPKSLEHISLKGVRALLVEDNNLNQEIARFYLEQEEIEVTTAVNGQEAVELFEESEIGYYDIILMDVMMPIMDGLEATRRIRSMNRPDGFAVPIIAMSANAFEEDIEKSLEAGMNAYLVKPLDAEKVTETMRQYLANKIQK